LKFIQTAPAAAIPAPAAGRQLTGDELGLLDEEAVLVAVRRGLVARKAGERRLVDIADEARMSQEKAAAWE
jgi:hypothetical protein